MSLLLLPALAGESVARAADALLTRGPYLQALLGTSVEIVWLTDVASRGSVRFGERGGPLQLVEEPEAATSHRVLLQTLAPATTYLYEVLEGDRPLAVGDDLHFRTAPRPGEGAIRAVALGDSGTGGEEQLRLAAVLHRLSPDIFIHTGDLDYFDDVDQTIFQPYRETLASACLFPARGNHDENLPWDELFFPPAAGREGEVTFYSYDWGSAHFAVLDTNLSLVNGSRQLAWLEEDLASARSLGQTWVILYFHEPPYSVGLYYNSGERVRRAIVPIADRFSVDLVLCGHDHNYQRSRPLRDEVVRDAWQEPTFASPAGAIYLVTGGGGQVLYPRGAHRAYNQVFAYAFHLIEIEITRDELAARAIGMDEEVIDSFTIKKNAARPELEFLRGDVDFDGVLRITDPILLLGYLFRDGAGRPSFCPAAGTMETAQRLPLITDAVYLLNYLFLGGRPPPAPFPRCGPAPGADDAFCMRSGC